MQEPRPDQVIDPVCGMRVTVADAEAAALTAEFEGRTFAFCGRGCLRAFREEPGSFAGAAAAAPSPVGAAASGTLPVIDDGMRRWYESCSCCLSEAYPDIKAALDAERAAATEVPVAAGICEVAEAAQ